MELLLDGCLRIAQMEDNLTALSFYFPTTLLMALMMSTGLKVMKKFIVSSVCK
jgi:hypothetical protein